MTEEIESRMNTNKQTKQENYQQVKVQDQMVLLVKFSKHLKN